MPPLPEVHHLFTIFQYRIDPLIRLLHIPTFMASMEIYFEFDINPVGHYHNPGTNIPLTKSESTTVYLGYSIASFEALLFAVIYAAIHALSSHELIQHVEDGRITHNIQKPSHHETNRKSDEDLKTQLLRYYRFATEQSLVRARFLESSDTVSVMALTILLVGDPPDYTAPIHSNLTNRRFVPAKNLMSPPFIPSPDSSFALHNLSASIVTLVSSSPPKLRLHPARINNVT